MRWIYNVFIDMQCRPDVFRIDELCRNDDMSRIADLRCGRADLSWYQYLPGSEHVREWTYMRFYGDLRRGRILLRHLHVFRMDDLSDNANL